MTATMTTTLAATFWMPERASSYAGTVDWVFYFVLWISVFFTILISALVVYFAIKHWDGGRSAAANGNGGRGKLGKGPSHHTALEMTWTIVPLVIVLAIFLFGFRGYMDMTEPPANPYEIVVRASQWNWSFQYPNGSTHSTLYLPVDTDVLVVLTVPRGDVIHSFFVPEFRAKMDAVPGRYNEKWFRPTRTGTFRLYCAEYCGRDHAEMLAEVQVLPWDEFQDAIEVEREGEPHEIGRQISQDFGCFGCHTEDGSPHTGPTFLNLYGSEQAYADGVTRTVDREHIRQAILRPAATSRAGFEGIVMPPFEGLLSDDDIENVIAYLRSISEHYEGPPTPDQANDDEPDDAPDGADAQELGEDA